MKLNVVNKDERFLIDVIDTNTIRQVKQIISNILNIHITYEDDDEEDNRTNFFLYYNGSILNDNCTLSEIGLLSGATVRCRHIRTLPYTLKVMVRFLKNAIELRNEISIDSTTIGELRSILQNRIGIPVSIFNLRQVNEKRNLFDNRSLSYYDIKQGDTLILNVWKGTKALILAALNGDISRSLSMIPSYHENPNLNRYYLKVALFIAAHMDFVNLAAQILQRGVRCDEPVSEYPSRQWCLKQSHMDVFKTPVHQAALQGSFRTLNTFLRHSPTCIVAKDGYSRMPSTYALQNRHMECWKLLMVAQFQFHSVCNFSLSTYSKIIKWCNRARDRVSYFKAENKKQMLLHTKLCPSDSTSLGDPIAISGFHDTLSGDSDSERVHKSSTWSYNMHNDEGSRRKSGTGSRKMSTSDVIEKQRKRKTSAVTSNYTNTLKQEVTTRSGTSKSNSSGNKSSKSDPDKFGSAISSRQEARLEARRIIYKMTGKTPFQIANTCFEMGQSFDNMKWRSQMNIALKCSLNRIENKNVVST